MHQVPPVTAVEAEALVISAVMWGAAQRSQVPLTSTHFYATRHRHLWEGMGKLRDGVSLRDLSGFMKSNYPGIDWAQEIFHIAHARPYVHKEELKKQIEEVREARRARELCKGLLELEWKIRTRQLTSADVMRKMNSWAEKRTAPSSSGSRSNHNPEEVTSEEASR